MLKAFEHFRDRGAGCDEPCQGHQDRNEREEDNAVGDYCERFHAEEYRGVDADIVATVGKGDACDRPHADLLAGNLGLVVIVVEAPEGSEGAATVRLNGIDGAVNTAAVDVVAHESAHVDIAIAFDTPTEGVGAIGATLRVFAGKNAVVRVTTIQTADDSWQCFDDEGYVLDESAKVEVRHTVLGAGESYTGLACDLRGTSSDIDVDTRYLGHGENELDFNYVIRHHGQRTMSEEAPRRSQASPV